MEDLDSDVLGPMAFTNGLSFNTLSVKNIFRLECARLVFIVFVPPLGPYTPSAVTNGPLYIVPTGGATNTPKTNPSSIVKPEKPVPGSEGVVVCTLFRFGIALTVEVCMKVVQHIL